MSWVLVPSLVKLRAEFNSLAPGRDKASDGSIGDTSHSAGASDHNPDETGNTSTEDADNKDEVHAIDVDADLRKSGWTMQRCVDIIVARHKAGKDDRLQYVIWKRRIASRSWGWTWRDYTGTSPHTEHAHFSSRYTTAQESDTRPWGLLAAEEDDMPSAAEVAAEVIKQLEASRGQAAIGKAVVGYKYGSRTYPTRTVADFLKDEHGKRDYQIGDKAGAKGYNPLAGSWMKVLEGIPASLAAQSKAIAAIAQAVASEDKDLDAILARLDQITVAQTGLAEDVREALEIGGTDEETAAALQSALGDRAAAVGKLLAES
ncbi:hypothetical protein [Actinoplanes sp. NPDC051494]|uniref:hypothetical protein n=1 Tax=Actinoplanes sp. NPDC051494 TaxID=3363907 RepID=UPI0037B6E02E